MSGVWPLLFVIFFLFLWFGICWVLSIMSGWQALVRQYEYKDHRASPKAQLTWQSLSMGYNRFSKAQYNKIVTVGSDGKYLYLSVMLLFRVGHLPLRIPFEDITISDLKTSIFRTKSAIAEKAPNIKIYMRAGLVKKIENLALRNSQDTV